MRDCVDQARASCVETIAQVMEEERHIQIGGINKRKNEDVMV